jgi:hypothetical protein
MEREDMAVDRKNATGFLHFRVSLSSYKNAWRTWAGTGVCIAWSQLSSIDVIDSALTSIRFFTLTFFTPMIQ